MADSPDSSVRVSRQLTLGLLFGVAFFNYRDRYMLAVLQAALLVYAAVLPKMRPCMP